MSLLSGVSSFFGLDIGTTGIRLVELRGTGPTKSLVKYAYVPVETRLAQSDSKADQQKLAQTIANLVAEAHLSSKNVAVGLPSNRVFTTVADLERMPEPELGKALMYQADSLIPTPPAESKIDWVLLGDSPKDKTQVEVLLSSVPNNFIEQRLDMIESIGLNVIAFEPDSMAVARAIVPAGTTMPQLVLDMGNLSTDLIITMGDAPRLTRSIPTGTEAVIRAAQQNLGVEDKQAQQFVYKFGVSKDKLEGQVYQAIVSTIDLLVGEVDKSIKFFQARYPESKLERITVTGGASAIPEFPLYIANKFGLSVEIGNAWRNVAFAAERQNELLAVSNQFSVAVGLAERNE
ncbi:MAG TPA: type IV pilus assembly protein PilM [Candidatus Saccharimonadales bacterium]|nr:type IV pilus assembly protein PilM [Candidatus Saccharimonadales bacterium]